MNRHRTMRANWQLHGFLTAVLMERNGTAMPQARGKAEVEAKRAEGTPALPHGQPRAWALGEMEEAAGEATDGNGRKNGARCDGKCSALQWATQRTEMTDAACCIFQSTFPGNPEQSAFISSPTYSSTQINQPPHHHRLSSAHLPVHVSPLTSTSYVLMKLILLPQPARSSSSVCTLVFHCLHTRFPQQAHSSSPACTLGFHSKRTRFPRQKAPVFLYQSACHHTARAFALPRQHDRLPQPGRSSSTTSTFGFLCQHARLLLSARSASPVRTLVIRSQPNHTPNRPAPLHPLKQQGQHADVAQHAALAVMVSARQAPVRCGGEP